MKILGVHPGPLMYTKVFLRLEPLGLGLVAAAARDPLLADHERPWPGKSRCRQKPPAHMPAMQAASGVSISMRRAAEPGGRSTPPRKNLSMPRGSASRPDPSRLSDRIARNAAAFAGS